jgi:hypothetical protein
VIEVVLLSLTCKIARCVECGGISILEVSLTKSASLFYNRIYFGVDRSEFYCVCIAVLNRL